MIENIVAKNILEAEGFVQVNGIYHRRGKPSITATNKYGLVKLNFIHHSLPAEQFKFNQFGNRMDIYWKAVPVQQTFSVYSTSPLESPIIRDLAAHAAEQQDQEEIRVRFRSTLEGAVEFAKKVIENREELQQYHKLCEDLDK